MGDTITLHGTESDLVMDVILMEVIDPAKASGFSVRGRTIAGVSKAGVGVRLGVELDRQGGSTSANRTIFPESTS